MDDPQQQIRLHIGALTVDNVILNARVRELEARLQELTAELIDARSNPSADSPAP